MRIPFLAVFLALSTEAVCAPTRVYEGTKTILTGPYDEKVAPGNRPEAFSPIEYPAVYLENDYLRCCLLPGVGGRIYEVYHKPTKSQVFHANPYLETLAAGGPTNHEWNLGGLEINFPDLGHGNTYNDVWQWAPIRGGKDFAGVVLARTYRRTMQRAVLRVLLRSDGARLDLTYRFENLSPYPWGLSGWINAAPAGSARGRWLLPPGWVTRQTPGRDPDRRFWRAPRGPGDSSPLETFTRDHGRPLPGRSTFAGIHDAAQASGLVRIYDPATLPVVKLAALPSPGRPELRARVYSETSTLTDGLWRRPELSAHEASESWYPIRGIGGCDLANENLALHVDRPARAGRVGRNVEIGICASRMRETCVVSLQSEHETLYRTTFDLDPAKPFKKIVPAPPGPVLVEVLGPDGRRLARHELRERPGLPGPDRPLEARETDALEDVRRGELLEALDGQADQFLGDSIRAYAALLRRDPRSTSLMVDLARSYLRDAQLRAGADEVASGPSTLNLEKAHDLLQDVVKRDRRNSRARFYLGIALEGLGKPAHAAGEYRAALKGVLAAPASGLYLAHTVIRKSAKDAVEAAEAAAHAYPESRRARHMLMVALIADKKAKVAVALGRELYRLDPADPLTTHLLSGSLKAAEELREATRFEEETARLIGDDEAARRGLDLDIEWLHGLDVRFESDS